MKTVLLSKVKGYIFWIALGVLLSFSVVTFLQGHLFFFSKNQLATVSGAVDPSATRFQALVVTGDDVSDVTLSNPQGGYFSWIAQNTLTPPPSGQSAFQVTQNGQSLAAGITDGVIIDDATVSGQVTVSVPALDDTTNDGGYYESPSGYLYTSDQWQTPTDVYSYEPLDLLRNSPNGIFPSSDQYRHISYDGQKYYFTFTVPENTLTRLVIFYKKKPVACRNITFDLLEKKNTDNSVDFTLAKDPVATAQDLSALVSPYVENSDSSPDYTFELFGNVGGNAQSYGFMGAYNLNSGRFAIVDYKTTQTPQVPPAPTSQCTRVCWVGPNNTIGGCRNSCTVKPSPWANWGRPKGPKDGIVEAAAAIDTITVPFDVNLQNIIIRSTPVPQADGSMSNPTTTYLPVGPFSAVCPAACQIDDQPLDISSGLTRCCTGLAPVEAGNKFVCTKI